MAIDLYAQQFRDLAELRYAATSKRLRASLGGATVLDTTDALLVWEPKRVVPSYAVPRNHVDLELIEHEPATLPQEVGPVLPPLHHEWHTVPGRSLHLGDRGEVAFRPEDPALAGRIVMHWDPFDWVEEDEPVVIHAHNPFSRIDVLRSSRRVHVEVGGLRIAQSTRPTALYETGLPTRWYLPREDVRMDLLTVSGFRTACAYQGNRVLPRRCGRPGRGVVLPRSVARGDADQGHGQFLASGRGLRRWSACEDRNAGRRLGAGERRRHGRAKPAVRQIRASSRVTPGVTWSSVLVGQALVDSADDPRLRASVAHVSGR